MLAIMEKYTNTLESLVDQRTTQLAEEKKKTEALLLRMLPRYTLQVTSDNWFCWAHLQPWRAELLNNLYNNTVIQTIKMTKIVVTLEI